ncbi:MAG: hypothetical protein QM532_01610 [Cyanobium sp. MAG06]|nr:hypothetical protein [Cyanobium sp. MAG06]
MKDKSRKIKIENNEQKIGIDIGSSGIKSILINENRSSIKYFYTHSNSIRNGLIINSAKFERDILDTIINIAIANNNIIPQTVSISTSSYRMKSYHDERNIYNNSKNSIISEELIERYLTEVTDNHNSNDFIVLGQQIYSTYLDDKIIYTKSIVGEKARKIKIKILTIYEDYHQYQIIYETLTNIGIKNIDIIAGPLTDAAAVLNKKSRYLGSASINIGRDNTTICIYENNLPIYISVLNIGTYNINQQLIKKIKLTEEEAESVLINKEKRELNSKNKSIENIINNEIENICKAISNDFKSVGKIGLLPGGVICSGGGARNGRLYEVLRYYLKVPIYNSDKKNNEKLLKDIDHRYLRAVGSTRFVKNLKELEMFKRLFKYIYKKIQEYFRKYSP